MAKDNDKIDIPVTNKIAPIKDFSISEAANKNPIDSLYESIKNLVEVTIPAINESLNSLDQRVTALEGRINNV